MSVYRSMVLFAEETGVASDVRMADEGHIPEETLLILYDLDTKETSIRQYSKSAGYGFLKPKSASQSNVFFLHYLYIKKNKNYSKANRQLKDAGIPDLSYFTEIAKNSEFVLSFQKSGKYILDFDDVYRRFVEVYRGSVKSENNLKYILYGEGGEVKEKKNKKIKTVTCSGCLKKKDISEIVDEKMPSKIFAFSSVDRDGYKVYPKYTKTNSLNFPLCYECFTKAKVLKSNLKPMVITIAKGKKADNLHIYFLPDLLTGISQESVQVVKQLIDYITDTDVHKEASDLINEHGDFVVFNGIVVKKSKSQEKALMYINDIYPSTLHLMFQQATASGISTNPIRFIILTMQQSISYSLMVLHKVLYLQQVDLAAILRKYSREIKENNKEWIRLIDFLYRMNNVRRKKEMVENYGLAFLDEEWKLAVFLLGAYTKKIQNILEVKGSPSGGIEKRLNVKDRKSLIKLLNYLEDATRNFDVLHSNQMQEVKRNIYRSIAVVPENTDVQMLQFLFNAGMTLYKEVFTETSK